MCIQEGCSPKSAPVWGRQKWLDTIYSSSAIKYALSSPPPHYIRTKQSNVQNTNSAIHCWKELPEWQKILDFLKLQIGVQWLLTTRIHFFPVTVDTNGYEFQEICQHSWQRLKCVSSESLDNTAALAVLFLMKPPSLISLSQKEAKQNNKITLKPKKRQQLHYSSDL